MRIGALVGLGLGVGIASLSGCVPRNADINAPPAPNAAAPIPLVPAAYAVGTPPVALTAPPPAPTVSSTRLLTVPAAAPVLEGRLALFPPMIFSPYHPHWMVDTH